MPDSECVFAVVLTRGNVRHMAQDWNLSDDELETVMQRLDDALYMAHVTELFPILSMN
ncbi:putative DNA methylase [Escherichia coli]|nr:putative DNA methylase [Escherichia coli]